MSSHIIFLYRLAPIEISIDFRIGSPIYIDEPIEMKRMDATSGEDEVRGAGPNLLILGTFLRFTFYRAVRLGRPSRSRV